MYPPSRTWPAVLILVGVATLGTPPAAHAQLLDFNIGAPTAGSISYAGGGAALVGTGIQVDSVVGLGTPIPGSYSLSSAALRFTTGGFVGSTATEWQFGPGGEIVLTGGIGALSIPDGTELFRGTFTGTPVVRRTADDRIVVDISSFVDQKDPRLVAAFGLPGGDYIGTINLSFEIPAGTVTGAAFTSTQLVSGNMTNRPIGGPPPGPVIPEPASVLLLGLGAAGLAGYGWRRGAARQRAVA